MKRILASLAVAACMAAPQGPALAVTDGELDGTRHPQVGLLVFDVVEGTPAWRCSGTLISESVMVTAGHCTDGATAGRVWFEADIDAGRPANGYPKGGGTSWKFCEIHTHPLFNTAPFVVHDVGVVVLCDAKTDVTYGSLPAVNSLDALKVRRGQKDVTLTAVGYGLQKSFPDAAAWKDQQDRVRMLAKPQLLQINVPGFTGDFSMLLSNNANTGGTCFGDSGGPNFMGNSLTIAGVTSFGINGNCAGTGGVFRLDRQNVLDFIDLYL
jgi:V8-like Glu-specific endopeptidase